VLSSKLIDFLISIIEYINWGSIYLSIRVSEFIAYNVLDYEKFAERNIANLDGTTTGSGIS